MSIATDNRDEQERIARQTAIKAALEAPAVASDNSQASPDDKAEPKVQTPSPKTAPYCGRPLHPWEVLVKGRPIQYRPMTTREREAIEEKALMDSQRRQDAEFAEKVRKAKAEADSEQKDMDKRHAHEKKTGKRPYGERRFIPLEQAIREGYVGQASSGNNNGRPEWWSEKNPDGIMGQG